MQTRKNHMANVPSVMLRQDLIHKNHEVYDDADSPVWRLVVYDMIHDGWEFTNMGGSRFLNLIAERSRLDDSKAVLELCSGMGATCRYLAETFGSYVTGIEVNHRQVARARERTSRLHQHVSEKIRFTHADITEWTPVESYDVVCAIESLVLVHDVPTVLKKAFACLKPGGDLFIADLFAGPNITASIRREALEQDAMVSLIGGSDYETLLTKAGFTQIRIEDKTALGEECLGRIRAAVQKHRREIIDREGTRGYKRWEHVTSFYLDCFAGRGLTYAWLQASCRKN
jgi:cyclopropane fatty-acyl-phospholipid synthase-like methyltransferase